VFEVATGEVNLRNFQAAKKPQKGPLGVSIDLPVEKSGATIIIYYQVVKL
jgi:hypothetical protein